jgi:hypothetical protein
MENINGKSRASFRWMLLRATIGLLVSIPTMLRAADLGTQGMQRLGTAPPEIMPFRCDSLDPKSVSIFMGVYSRVPRGCSTGQSAATACRRCPFARPRFVGIPVHRKRLSLSKMTIIWAAG